MLQVSRRFDLNWEGEEYVKMQVRSSTSLEHEQNTVRTDVQCAGRHLLKHTVLE